MLKKILITFGMVASIMILVVALMPRGTEVVDATSAEPTHLRIVSPAERDVRENGISSLPVREDQLRHHVSWITEGETMTVDFELTKGYGSRDIPEPEDSGSAVTFSVSLEPYNGRNQFEFVENTSTRDMEITIPAGDTVKSIQLRAINDRVAELDMMSVSILKVTTSPKNMNDESLTIVPCVAPSGKKRCATAAKHTGIKIGARDNETSWSYPNYAKLDKLSVLGEDNILGTPVEKRAGDRILRYRANAISMATDFPVNVPLTIDPKRGCKVLGEVYGVSENDKLVMHDSWDGNPFTKNIPFSEGIHERQVYMWHYCSRDNDGPTEGVVKYLITITVDLPQMERPDIPSPNIFFQQPPIEEPTPTPTNTPVPQKQVIVVPTATDTPTPTPTMTATATATATNTVVPTATATNTPVPTATNTPTVTPTPTNTPTPTPVPALTESDWEYWMNKFDINKDGYICWWGGHPERNAVIDAQNDGESNWSKGFSMSQFITEFIAVRSTAAEHCQ